MGCVHDPRDPRNDLIHGSKSTHPGKTFQATIGYRPVILRWIRRRSNWSHLVHIHLDCRRTQAPHILQRFCSCRAHTFRHLPTPRRRWSFPHKSVCLGSHNHQCIRLRLRFRIRPRVKRKAKTLPNTSIERLNEKRFSLGKRVSRFVEPPMLGIRCVACQLYASPKGTTATRRLRDFRLLKLSAKLAM